jgi:hypothetical protein
MAYVNFAELEGGLKGTIGVYGEAPPAHRSGFTALEWQVVALAQQDSLSTLETPSRLTLALEAVFGFKRVNPELANPALEALRRISVLAWHRGHVLPQSQIKAFHDAGYSEDQLETLLGSIGAGRLARKRKAFA